MSMDRHMREALDRHITGNYGERQFQCPHEGYDEPDPPTCQVSNCDEEAEDGVLCHAHQPPEDDGGIGSAAWDLTAD